MTEAIDVFGFGGLSVPSHLVRGLAASHALSGMATARSGVPADTAFIERVEVVEDPSGVVSGFATDFGDLGGDLGGPTAWRLVGYASRPGRSEGVYLGKTGGKGSGGLLGAVNYQGGEVSAGRTPQIDRRRSVPAPASLGLPVVDGRFAVVLPADAQVAPEDPADRVWSCPANLQFDLAWRMALTVEAFRIRLLEQTLCPRPRR